MGYKSFPENGVIIYCGEVALDRGDKTQFEYTTITPPKPVQSFSYRCDAKFDTDSALALASEKDTYGLIVLDLQEACWGTLEGSAVKVMGTYDSIVPNKHGQGGQSQHRFEQLREIAINEYFIKLSERVNTSYLPLLDKKVLKGIIIGGCGMTKDEFVKSEHMHHELRKKIIGTFDTSYTNEYGLGELVNASKNDLKDIGLRNEKIAFDEFLKELARDGKVAYGESEVLQKAVNGQVKQVLLSTSRIDLFDQVERNNTTNYQLVLISMDSDSGVMLDKAFGGIVAMLRYG
jgi:peptide chain release factor subunit 1